MTSVEAAARALWRLGNVRIGERPWESVSAHYIAEAVAALEAAGHNLRTAGAEQILEDVEAELKALLTPDRERLVGGHESAGYAAARLNRILEKITEWNATFPV